MKTDWFAFAFSTWLGFGYIPVIPTLVAVFSIALVYWVFGGRPSIFWPFTVGTILIGWWASHQTGQFTGISDDGRIVVDEVAGAALLLAFVRPRDHWKTALLLIGYLAIDGIKPWPMSAMEALPGAYGVMGDDLMIAALVGIFLIPLRLWQAWRN
ncbi:phosphatidylglycerophosphatase A [Devosia sp.]|uniref:phosphatidylglycerophosphatase A n=1 Tax=Devosia sp. TaxID=1871048 RepID=UPI0027372084|nr:phosphatidylglycerophosphatase A [Devosia sp.]MDP2781359.1 phosphatidylglycerophosphatase A [Devosia sp.]